MKKFEAYKAIKNRRSPQHKVRIVENKKLKPVKQKFDWNRELCNS